MSSSIMLDENYKECPKCELPNKTLMWRELKVKGKDLWVCIDCFGEKTPEQVKRMRNKQI